MALTVEQQKYVEKQVKQYGRSIALAYVFYFLFGFWGVHRFYLGKIKTGLLYIALSLMSLILIIASISWDFMQCVAQYTYDARSMCTQPPLASPTLAVIGLILLLLLFLWLLVDLFLVPAMARQMNKRLYEQYSAKLEAQPLDQASF